MNRKTYIVTATNKSGNKCGPTEVKLFPVGFDDSRTSLVGYPKFLESHGWTDVEIQVKPRAKRGTANPVAKYKFQVDPERLQKAIDFLEIKKPVDIRYHNRQGSTNGSHYFDGKRHNIMLKGYKTAEEASSTLWHELTHAMQSEKLGKTAFDLAYQKEGRTGNAYRNNKFEVEAREMADKMFHVRLTISTES